VYGESIGSTTDSDHAKPVAPKYSIDALRLAVNRAWTADITYLPTDEGWLYLAAILDLGTVACGWAMSERINAKLVLSSTDGVLEA